MSLTDLVPFVGALGGLGALALAYTAVRKIGVEKTDIKITTADKVLVGQGRWIDNLEEQLALCNARIDDQTRRLDAALAQIDELRSAVVRYKTQLSVVTEERDRLLQENSELHDLRRENVELRDRVAHLEQRVEDLSSREGRAGPAGPAGPAGAEGDTGRTGLEGRTGKTGPAGRSFDSEDE